MHAESTKTKIYIGGEIEHESERKFLAAVEEWIETQGIPAVVLANVEIGGRQIDCVVATAGSVAVVEVKSSWLPVRGDMNGRWGRLLASGEWQDFSNAYQQGLGAKNRLRDAMHAFKSIGSYHPDGYVVFTRPLPPGSSVTAGNFKVQVTTLNLFVGELARDGNSPWSLSDWEAFARSISLTPTTLSAAVAGERDRAEHGVLKRYLDAFALEYGREGARWLPDTDEQREALLSAVTSEAGCYVSGPSGCGKSLMTKWLSADLAVQGHPTFFLAAKDFSGSWADSLRREVGLLTDGNPTDVYRAALRCDQQIFLVLDGINEFGAAAPGALRGARALARRMGARLIISAQSAKPETFAGLHSVDVASPSRELKRRIAAAAGAELTPTVLGILGALRSGIEAELVGQIGADLKAGATRLLLVDQYIRKRLADHARAGSFGLRRFASTLHEQVAFSMSEAQFDEFMRSHAVSFNACDALFSVGLLVRRAGRVSFSHEMIQNACAAFDLAGAATADAEGFGRRLSTPLLDPIAGDIIAAIEDGGTCRAVLEQVTSSSTLASAANGELGHVAAACAQMLLSEAAMACIDEIRCARLTLSEGENSVLIGWEEETRRVWTPGERARLGALGLQTRTHTGLDAFLNLCAEMDARLVAERARWRDFAGETKYPIKSQSFALTYLGFGDSIGFTTVARSTQGGFDRPRGEAKLNAHSFETMTSGQLYFYLERRRAFADSEGFAEALTYLFQKRFRWEPYHVQLSMLGAVGYTREAPEESHQRLVEAINALDVAPSNWAINSSIIDALKILGALEDDGEQTRAQVKAELASVLDDDDTAVDGDLALSLCVSMFDHPYDFIYGQEIFGLDEALRRRLYRRALGASDIRSSMSLNWLVREVVAFDDPADATVLRTFTRLPSRTNPFAQDEWASFAVATRFAARFHAALDPVEATTAAEFCLEDIRSLIYVSESRRDDDEAEARRAWQRLHQLPAQLVVGCLSEIQSALSERSEHVDRIDTFPPLDLRAVHPQDYLRLCRAFIDDGEPAQFFHDVPDLERGTAFAFDTVAVLGDRSDVDRLRGRSRGHSFARHALSALKRLDAVATGRPG